MNAVGGASSESGAESYGIYGNSYENKKITITADVGVLAKGNTTAMTVAPTLDSGVTAGGSTNIDGSGAVVYNADDNATYKWFHAPVTAYTVTVSARANMTLDNTDVSLTQTLLEGNALNEICFIADDGYYFPADYASLGTINGVTVMLDSGDVIISGIPSDDVTITLADASPVSEPESKTVETPVLPESGSFTGTKSITITCATDDASIYYTTDGSVPTVSSTAYTGAFTITATTTVKAIAVKDSMTNSEIATATYTRFSGGGGGITTYPVTAPAEVDNAEVTVSPKNAASGATVTITVTPDEGYKVDSVTVTDSKGNEMEVTDNGDGTYTFKMPASKVTVTPVIVEIEDAPVPTADRPFVDVTEDNWFYEPVYYCYDNNYFQGVDDTHYDPHGTMTRAMFATVLHRIAGEPEVTGENPFTDVEADTWYTDAVIWAAREEIIEGYGNGRFGTNDPVTREQMVTLLYRYAVKSGVDVSVGENTNILDFDDATDTSDWAVPAMQWAVGAGVVGGKPGGILDPKGTATRAEVAQIVMNFGTKV